MLNIFTEYIESVKEIFKWAANDLSTCQKCSSWTTKEAYKNELDIMNIRHNEVNSEAAFDDHQNISKCSENVVLSNMGDLRM